MTVFRCLHRQPCAINIAGALALHVAAVFRHDNGNKSLLSAKAPIAYCREVQARQYRAHALNLALCMAILVNACQYSGYA